MHFFVAAKKTCLHFEIVNLGYKVHLHIFISVQCKTFWTKQHCLEVLNFFPQVSSLRWSSREQWGEREREGRGRPLPLPSLLFPTNNNNKKEAKRGNREGPLETKLCPFTLSLISPPFSHSKKAAGSRFAILLDFPLKSRYYCRNKYLFFKESGKILYVWGIPLYFGRFVCVCAEENNLFFFRRLSLLSHSRQQSAWSSFHISMCLFLEHVFPAASTVRIRTILSLSKFKNRKGFIILGDLSNSTCIGNEVKQNCTNYAKARVGRANSTKGP